MKTFEELRQVSYASVHYTDDGRLGKLYEAARHVDSAVSGDLVECGVASGSSAVMIAGALTVPRKLWLYDLWTGQIPSPGEMDSPGLDYLVPLIGGRLEDVQSKMRRIEYPEEMVVYRQGLFEETFKLEAPARIALLHLDGDWYESVYQALAMFYDRVVDGGVIIMDDFGYFEGVGKAFYDFVRSRDIFPLLMVGERYQAIWVKGKATNILSYPY